MFILALISAMAVGCERAPELEESHGSEITVFADIEQMGKTSLDANGYTVKWKEGDKLEALYSSTNGLTCQSMYLVGGAGTPDGIFSANFSALSQLYGILYPAPADKSPLYYVRNNHYVAGVTFDDNQVSYASGDIGRYDFKASNSFTSVGNGRYSVTFKQQTVFLDFLVTPTPAMVADGEKILDLSLSAPHAIAGDMYVDLMDPSVKLEPDNDNTRKVIVTPDVEMPLKNGVPSELRMFVIPNIKQGDELNIELHTGNYYVSVEAKAAKEYQPGYKYRMTLDLPALVAAGRATVVKNDSFLLNDTDFGILDISDMSDQKPIFVIGGGWQCGGDATCFRMVNWAEKRVLWIKHPENMRAGDKVSLEISSYGDPAISSGTVNAVVAKLDKGICWLKDESAGTGYIIKVAQ